MYPVPLVPSIGYGGDDTDIVSIHMIFPQNPIALSKKKPTAKGYYHITSAMLVHTMLGQTFLIVYILFCLITLYVRRDRC